MVPADIHLFNNAEQWEIVFEIRPGEPTPAAIAPRPRTSATKTLPGERKDLSRRPRSGRSSSIGSALPEEAWFADALPAALSAGKTGEEAITLFTEVLAAQTTSRRPFRRTGKPLKHGREGKRSWLP